MLSNKPLKKPKEAKNNKNKVSLFGKKIDANMIEELKKVPD